MKKFITLFAVAALGAALIGCSSGDSASTDGTTGTTAATTGTTAAGTTAAEKPAATTGE